jgi:hypothetical protein
VSAPTAADVPRHTAKVIASPSRVKASPKKTSETPQLAPKNTMAANVPQEIVEYVDHNWGTVSSAITVGTTATPKTEKANQECSHCHFLFNFMGSAYAAFMIEAHKTNKIAWTVSDPIDFLRAFESCGLFTEK